MSPEIRNESRAPQSAPKKQEKKQVHKQSADDVLREKLDIEYRLDEELDGSDFAIFSSLSKTIELVKKLPPKNRQEIFGCFEAGIRNLLENAGQVTQDIQDRLESTKYNLQQAILVSEPGDYEDIPELLEELEFTSKELVISTKYHTWVAKNFQKFCELCGQKNLHDVALYIQSEKDAKDTYTKNITYCHSVRLKIDEIEQRELQKQKQGTTIL